MWNFAFWSFSTAEHLLHHSQPQHSYTPLDAFKPHKHTYTLPKCSQTPPSGISGHFRTTTDTNRHQQTPNNTNRRCQTPKKAVQGCVAVYVDINFCLLVSDDILYCLMLSADVRRVSKKFLKGYLGAAYWFVQALNAYKGVWECSGLVLCSKCSILEKLQEANFHTPDSFETSKYQNLPIWAL